VIAEPIAFAGDHFIYSAGTGRTKCSRCNAAITPGEAVRIPADLDDNGWWHEHCPEPIRTETTGSEL